MNNGQPDKFKIVFIAPFGIRPKGTVIARMLPLAEELQQSGHSVVIVSPPYTNPEDSGRVEILRGVRLVNVLLPNAGKVVGTLIMTWRMFRAVQAEKADLLHLFKPKGYGGLAVMLIWFLEKFGMHSSPLFIDSDDWEGKGGMNDINRYSAAERMLFAYQEKRLIGGADGVTVASRELEHLVSRLGVAASRIEYVPNGVEAVVRQGDGDFVRDRFNISWNAPVILLYTRFFEFSQERLYRVFKEIYRSVPDVRFLVIGKGRCSEEEALADNAHRHGFHSALAMAGWVEPEYLPDYLDAADVAIYPMEDNLVNRAKCPAKLTELLNAGVPVVADAVGQAKEYVINGETGILSNPDDWKSMADAVIGLLADADQRRQFGSMGRGRLRSDFAWPRLAGRLEAFYARCIGRI